MAETLRSVPTLSPTPKRDSMRRIMTKAEIVDAVYDKVGGFSKKEAAEAVEEVFEVMKDVLARGEKIKVSGFGNFIVRQKNERIGRNPQTGKQIAITARRVLNFKPSQVLKAILNPGRDPNSLGARDEDDDDDDSDDD